MHEGFEVKIVKKIIKKSTQNICMQALFPQIEIYLI